MKKVVSGVLGLVLAALLLAMAGWTGSTEAQAATSSPGVTGLDSRCNVPGRVLCVDKTTDKLYYLKDQKVMQTMDARFGCARTRTREGVFSVQRKSRNHVSSIYHTAMPYAMFFSGGQAVHYSPDFAARGYRGCSHGCVNIRDRAGIRALFDQIRVGDRVVVYKR
ncbi:MAG TPA: L,D-transpeptidase [Propionibacteriaceae bacterium]